MAKDWLDQLQKWLAPNQPPPVPLRWVNGRIN